MLLSVVQLWRVGVEQTLCKGLTISRNIPFAVFLMMLIFATAIHVRPSVIPVLAATP